MAEDDGKYRYKLTPAKVGTVSLTYGNPLPLPATSAFSGAPAVSVLQRGVVYVQVESETEPGKLVTRRINLECTDDLDKLAKSESEFFERQQAELYKHLYPAALPLRLHPLYTPRKPSLRERLVRATYPLRSRLASWLVGRDVDACDEDEGY